MKFSDPLAYDMPAPEAYIKAMLEVEWTHSGGRMDGRGCGPNERDVNNVTDKTGNSLGGTHTIPQSHGEQCCIHRGSRQKRNRCAVDITTLTPFLSFHNDVLIEHVP